MTLVSTKVLKQDYFLFLQWFLCYRFSLSLPYCYTGDLTFEHVDRILKLVTIQKKDTEQYFPVLLFITLYKVVPNF